MVIYKMYSQVYLVGAYDTRLYKSYGECIEKEGKIDVKIGGTADTMKKRLSNLQTGNSHKLEVIKTVSIYGKNFRETETKIQDKFKDKHIQGEWYSLTMDDINSVQDDEIINSNTMISDVLKLIIMKRILSNKQICDSCGHWHNDTIEPNKWVDHFRKEKQKLMEEFEMLEQIHKLKESNSNINIVLNFN